jgi:hypothetical protein
MTPTSITSAVAAEHIGDLREHACSSRMAALAHCCRPSTWARAARGVVARLWPTAQLCDCG